MIDYLQFLFPYVARFKYLAIFVALVSAGFGVPVPEEVTLILGGYMVSIGQMHLVLTILVCYLGVLGGDIVTYIFGRYGGGWIIRRSFFKFVVSRQRLAQAQYYYRKHGPRFLLFARQVPGLRFPSFFSAGLLKVPFLRFLAYDSVAALISMPVVFFTAYYFGPRIQGALAVVADLRSITLYGAIVLLLIIGLGYLLYFRSTRRSDS